MTKTKNLDPHGNIGSTVVRTNRILQVKTISLDQAIKIRLDKYKN